MLNYLRNLSRAQKKYFNIEASRRATSTEQQRRYEWPESKQTVVKVCLSASCSPSSSTVSDFFAFSSLIDSAQLGATGVCVTTRGRFGDQSLVFSRWIYLPWCWEGWAPRRDWNFCGQFPATWPKPMATIGVYSRYLLCSNTSHFLQSHVFTEPYNSHSQDVTFI